VHPESKANTGVQQEFVVTADAASGATTINISPSIILSGAYQNVTSRPCRRRRRHPAGHGRLLAPGQPRLPEERLRVRDGGPRHAERGRLQGPRGLDGISMRIVRQYDINNDKFPCRLDVLWGAKTLRPQHASACSSTAARNGGRRKCRPFFSWVT
jgi:hypothetical protein